MKLITKIKKELNDVYSITAIAKAKNIIIIYILAEDYRKMVYELLKEKLTLEEFEQVKIIVSGPIIPAED